MTDQEIVKTRHINIRIFWNGTTLHTCSYHELMYIFAVQCISRKLPKNIETYFTNNSFTYTFETR